MADDYAQILEELTGLDEIAGYTTLPATGGTVEAVIDYDNPTDAINSERASAIVVYADRSPVVVSPAHAIREGTSEVLRGIPADGGALVIGCTDGSVAARITVAASGAEVVAERERDQQKRDAEAPGWLAALERMIGSAAGAVKWIAIAGVVVYVGSKAGLLGGALKAAGKVAK